MSEHFLIVSDPPQPAGDLSSVAPLFDMAPIEVRMKANYGVPEIWFADQEETGASKVAEGLASAGLRFALARGSSLGSVPAGRVIEAFAFGESSLVLHEQGGRARGHVRRAHGRSLLPTQARKSIGRSSACRRFSRVGALSHQCDDRNRETLWPHGVAARWQRRGGYSDVLRSLLAAKR